MNKTDTALHKEIQNYISVNFRETAAGNLLEPPAELTRYVAKTGMTFSRKLMDYIKRSGEDEPSVYKRANITRQLFSKIRSDPDYHPDKRTAISFAVALRLSLKDTSELLYLAGYALSNAAKSDLIIKYFFEKRIYDMIKINNALFEFGQPVLGT